MTNPLKILVIDDDKIVRDHIAMIFKSLDVELLQASSGTDGIKKFQDNSPNLVLCDMHLADLNGIEITKNIRKINNDAIIIGISVAFVDGKKNFFQELLELRVSSFVNKPIKKDELLSKIKKYFPEFSVIKKTT